MANPAQSIDPHEEEQRLILTLLLGLRAQGRSDIDNTGGALHQAFAEFLEAEASNVKRLIGSVPAPHPLFGS